MCSGDKFIRRGKGFNQDEKTFFSTGATSIQGGKMAIKLNGSFVGNTCKYVCGPEGFPRKHNKKKRSKFTKISPERERGIADAMANTGKIKKFTVVEAINRLAKKEFKHSRGLILLFIVLTLGFAAWWALLPRQVLHQPWACLDTHYVSLIREILAAKQTEAQSILTQSGMCEQEIKKAIEEGEPSRGNRARGGRVGPAKTIPKGIKDQNPGGEHCSLYANFDARGAFVLPEGRGSNR